jgi:hypothetical protein
VFLVAPEGSYEVVAGDLDAERPAYDVEQARDLVLVLEAAAATLGEVETNPAFREPTFFERSGWETVVLTAVLSLVVLVLFALTLRVARAAGSDQGAAPAPVGPTGDVASRPATSQGAAMEGRTEPGARSESSTSSDTGSDTVTDAGSASGAGLDTGSASASERTSRVEGSGV